MRVTVYPPDYKLMFYEEQLAVREIELMLPESNIISRSPIVIEGVERMDLSKLEKLTYAKKIITETDECEVIQYNMERSDNSKNRQNTRYSTHGIHEYKGKFNPQIVCYMLNASNVGSDSRVFDPFCGSGTTLLECAHHGIEAIGVDINPLAVTIANTKLQALSIDTHYARNILNEMIQSYRTPVHGDSSRDNYLKKWLPSETLDVVEYIKDYTEHLDDSLRDLIRVIVSDQIRDYSNQEPGDLRIRRRKSPLPTEPLWSIIRNKIENNLSKIDRYQSLGLPIETRNKAINDDITELSNELGSFDCALTSPPYATALPYIDTQRISLVWLDLVKPENIGFMESSLIGSREERGIKRSEESEMTEKMLEHLPDSVSSLIRDISDSLMPSDGFRKQATPFLLSRYFDSMRKMFISVQRLVKSGGTYKLIVGPNKTSIGKGFYIDTPKLLCDVATQCGWDLCELIPLQTYSRYGMHSKNSINEEKMINLIRS